MLEIIQIIFIGVLILTVCFIILFILFYSITQPYFKYQLSKPNNKLQWRCEETQASKENRLKDKNINFYSCELSYRILPSELNWFTRVFSDNKWKYPFNENTLYYFEFEDKYFKRDVNNFKTYKDIKSFENKENNILWIEPEE